MNIYDPRNRKTVQATLRQGAETDFWKILRDSINETIEKLEEERRSPELINLPGEQFKTMVIVLDSKIENLKLLQNMPRTLAAWLEAPEAEQTTFDPYFTAKDMGKT